MACSKQAVVLLALVALMRALNVWGGQDDQEQTKTPIRSEGNALCYTCHLGLQHEAITAQHAVPGVTCTSCHGPSVEHMQDEMQVTKPDRLFGRGEVNDMCRACHEGHADVRKVEVFRDQWLGKTRPNGRVITKTSICTDCHGSHNYIIEPRPSAAPESPWLSLFNGRDLEGWEASETAHWAVKAARLTAVADASQKRNCIVTKDEYADFQLSITFRASWPIRAWVSLRQGKDARGPSVTIGDSGTALGRPGSVWLSEKTVALANLRENTVDRLTWNTMRIEARQNQYATWLNGEEIGRVRLDGPPKGKIAIHMAAHAENKESWLQISDDPHLLLEDSLGQFDAIVMNNIHEPEPFLPEDFAQLKGEQKAAAQKLDEAVKRSILEYVRRGGGVMGIHAATAACQSWPAYGEMMGGYYGGHISQEVVIRPEDPTHPVNACFDGKPFTIRDEIYISREPYSRQKVHVLASLDLSRMEDPQKRPDKDYAVSWVRAYGKGRVFYTTLGHEAATYWNPVFLQHLLAGVQFAIGDLEGEMTPVAAGS